MNKIKLKGSDSILSRLPADWNHNKKLGVPGEFPFTRGIYPGMYKDRLWTIRQYAGFGTARDTNWHFHYLLKQGQTGLSVAFDLPTQLGYDSDDPRSLGEVGKVGVAVDTLYDMETLFAGIDLGDVSVSMTINSTAAVLLAMYIALAGKRNVPIASLRGTIQNDILKEYIARGTYIFPPEPSLRLAVDIVEYCSGHIPLFHPISISGYHIREAGSTAAQEIGYTFANALAYVDEAVKRGLGVDEFAGRLAFFFSAHNSFFEEIAKFRAARRLWAKIMRSRYKPKNMKSLHLRFHTQTAGCTLTAEEPVNNIVRVACQALAAVFGGTQSLHTNSYDEALSLPTKESALAAIRTQQILAFETEIPNSVDPLGGSYHLEALTDQMETAILNVLEKVEKTGVLRSIEAGFIQREIMNSAYRYQMEIEEKKRYVIGKNLFADEAEAGPGPRLFKNNEKAEKHQIKKLATIKRRRNDAWVKSALDDLSDAARSRENMMPALIEAAARFCTLGEMCRVLRDQWGEYTESVNI